MVLSSPTKRAKVEPLKLVDDRQQTLSPATVGDEEEKDVFSESAMSEVELQKRFIGDIHLPEGMSEEQRQATCFTELFSRPRAPSYRVEASFRIVPHSIS